MIDEVRSVARSYFDGRVSPAHDWHHVERVEALARRLAADRDDVDERVLVLAVLLHDVGRPGEEAGTVDDHAEWGAREARSILAEFDLDPGTVDAVAHCVRAHRYSNDVDPETVEARVLCDADNLDALGAVGLARCFSYGGEHGIPFYDPDLPVSADESPAGHTSVNHLRKKILSLPDRMYTEEGRRLAERRRAVVEEFLDRFEAEIAGER
ncbi:HD domain-containing protein [Salinilacihabitans rarus]|uniref:HD domain-containing protein n=1 Tax=Salinilacihabitans rarus TaxID=2961596 RepID=UPI0020C88EA4|nr:HD domain-containing protein [Salinilacihabitans rarus]